jgi:hypothetical protein
MLVNIVAYEDSVQKILPEELKGVSQHELNQRGGDNATACNEDRNTSTGLNRISDDGDLSGNEGSLTIERAG